MNQEAFSEEAVDRHVRTMESLDTKGRSLYLETLQRATSVAFAIRVNERWLAQHQKHTAHQRTP